MKEIASILKQFNTKQRLFVLTLMLFFITIGAVTTAYFKSTGCEPLIKQNQELVQSLVSIEKTIVEYKQLINEVQNDPCLTEGAAAAVIDSAVTGSDVYTNEGYIDPSMVVMDSVLKMARKPIE
jgi:hypothetical protein